MREIDGSHGEGGGQLLRTACALAALTGTAIRLTNIRARRAQPGLFPQHLTAVKAVAALCAAQVEGLEPRSQELVFRPGRLRGGRFRFDVGTAGCLTLVLQALLPVALACGEPVRMQLTGGTDVARAPPLDYFRYVLLPILAGMGAKVSLSVIRHGYYPRGGGEVVVEAQPAPLGPLRLEAPVPVTAIHGVAHVANLPEHIVERMHATVVGALAGLGEITIRKQVLDRERAIGQGGAIVLWTADGVPRGAAEVAQRGVPAEEVAGAAVRALRAEIAAGATLDIHASDQVLIYAALARGPSCFLARELSSHARTCLWLLEQFLPVRAAVHPAGPCTRVEIFPEPAKISP